MSSAGTTKHCDTVVVGGGAAGIVAAISARRAGRSVIIAERTSQIGKKLLATGNGRCNLLNETLTPDFYNPGAREIVRQIFVQFGKTEILTFFRELGLETYAKDGRIFPVTNQAATVLKVLEIELSRLKIPVEFGFKCTRIQLDKNDIVLSSESRQIIACHNVIVTGGGNSYPAFGSDGNIYDLARGLGHHIVEPVPATVPLVVKDQFCHLLQGQRINARVQSVIGGKLGPPVEGELLFTKYGLSGTCILDISEPVSIALNRERQNDVCVSADLVPFLSADQLRQTLRRRQEQKCVSGEMLVGILPNKIAAVYAPLFEVGTIDKVVDDLKGHRFKIHGTRGWNEAEFTAGGVAVNAVNPSTLESRLHPGVYFAGEVLDVNGARGGYNLGWAWASGYVAGLTQKAQC